MGKQCKIKYQSILFGNVGFISFVFISLLVFSFILMKNNINNITVVINVIIVIASFISGIIGGFVNKCNGIMIAVILSLCQILMLIFMGIISNEITSIFSGENLIKVLFILSGNVLGCFIGVNIKKKY